VAWHTSDRRSRLPKDWRKRRATVLERDPLCQLRTHCDGAPSTEVDHRIAGDDHRLGNLQGVCSPCHTAKTTADRLARRTRPAESHPGRL
jgi:5-methylcytosine-specific restriction enzyme A